jgi:hypothetical protein
MNELPITSATYITHCFKSAARAYQQEETWVKFALSYIDNTVLGIHNYISRETVE